MRRHHIWYVLAVFWGADALLASIRGHTQAAVLAACIAVCFLAAGLVFRKREQRRSLRRLR